MTETKTEAEREREREGQIQRERNGHVRVTSGQSGWVRTNTDRQ